MSRALKILIVLIVVIFLGIIIPLVVFDSQKDFEDSQWSTINSLLENPIEQFFVLGFKSVDDLAEEYDYHVEVKTIFGLKYADIYLVGDGEVGSSGFIERKILFKDN